jgi:acyl-coenzyme A thioesterase PaaI-like protein
VLIRIAPGEVEIALPFRDALTQQHGYIHGGIVTAIADSPCGYAAVSLSPAGEEVLTLLL